MLLTFWFCFGTNTVVNGFVFSEVIGDGQFAYPSNTREAAIAIVAVWAGAYLAGVAVGLVVSTKFALWHVINSVVAGYLLAALLHLFIIGPFPTIPISSFGVLRDLASLEPLPVYYTFALMILVLGPVLVGVATYTGYLVAKEYPNLRLLMMPTVNIPAFLVAILVPASMMMVIIGSLNACDTDNLFGFKGIGSLQVDELCDYDDKQVQTASYRQLVNNVNRSLPFNEQETVPTILIFYLDLLPNALVNAVLALLVGVLIGFTRHTTTRDIALSAALGMMAYISLMLILVSILKPSSSARVDYTPVYNDRLGNLSDPDVVIFLTLWIIPPLIAAASAFAIHTLREMSTDQRPAIAPLGASE